MANAQTLEDVVCLGCGCLCDDLRVTLQAGRAQAAPSCRAAQDWIDRVTAWKAGPCLIEGRAASRADAVRKAVEVLGAAHAPLVCGLAGAGTDAQRIAVGIADRLGGYVDWTTTPGDAASVEATQTVGAVGASLGEIAQRADLVVFWQCDPAVTHPRHFERYSLQPAGAWLPRGRADRHVVAVGDPGTATAAAADEVIELPVAGAIDALVRLRAALTGVQLDPPKTGDRPQQWEALAERVRDARFAAVFYGDQLQQQGAAALVELTLLAQSLQETTRLVAAQLGGVGNGVGAKQVMTWQTGFPMAASFAAGWPEYGAPEFTTEALLASGEADAVLVVAELGLDGLSAAARRRISTLPSVVLSAEASDSLASTVRFSVPPLGARPGGSVFRSDGVALPLTQLMVDDTPGDAAVLAELAARLSPVVSGPAAGP